jgi:hypothetical protein
VVGVDRLQQHMETNMFKNLATGLPFSALATAGLAAQTVSEIDVSVDLPAIENSEAAQVWTSLGTDLETAIAERIAPQLGEDGSEVVVDINEVALASAFENAYALDNSTLAGLVEIREPGLLNNEAYELSITAGQAMSAASPEVDLANMTIASTELYRAMIDAFADNVAQKLK